MNPFTKSFIQAACLICALPLLARQTLPLDNWRFQLNDAADACAAKNFDDAAWDTIKLPHTWNAFDGGTGDTKYFRGTGWYRARITLPASAKGKRVLLEFDGAALATRVFVNGQPLGEHVGGYARFRFDATDAVNFSDDNVVAVRVDNRQTDFLNRNGDFTVFGGLYRPARILLTAPAHIATLDHASPGVFLTVKTISTNGADVDARIEFANEAAKKFSGLARVTVRSPDGVKVSSATAKIKITANGKAEINLPLQISNPRLWNGTADPFVYAATVELLDGGEVIDSVTQPLGLRSFAVKPDAGFFLNGEHVPLHGVNRHQDWPDKGWAIGTNEMYEDFSILRELGANTVRLCHYQHDQFFYDLCDSGGLAVWAELAFVNEPPLTPAGRDNAKKQLRELIRQNYNHPAIFFWSLGNETWEVRGATNAAENLLRELAAVARAEDPTRLSVYASHHELDDRRNFIADALAFNKYFGWYLGEFPQFGKFLDDFHAANPRLPVGVAEYGAGASIYQHEENPQRPKPNGTWHPEEWQTKFHEEYWLQLKSRPWIWGTYVWCLFDFASANRDEGDMRGLNDKGLVTADRLMRKDAFYWYQANWTTNAMAHITSKRFCDRTNAATELKIYSNADEVEAKLNGVSLGKKSSGDCRFVWPQIELRPGVNRIEAVAFRAGKPVATDSCAWNFRLPAKDVASHPK